MARQLLMNCVHMNLRLCPYLGVLPLELPPEKDR